MEYLIMIYGQMFSHKNFGIQILDAAAVKYVDR